MDITIHYDEVRRIETLFREFPIAAVNENLVLSREWARTLRDRVRSRAPFETGEYVSTIRVVGSSVVTDHPAARRLELGFIGVDSLGRHYTQMPDPHWTPSVEEVQEEYFADNLSMIRRLLGRGHS